jgi:hypothetical protein
MICSFLFDWIVAFSQTVEKGSPASLRSIASLQRIGKYASARRFFARLASEAFLNSLNLSFQDFFLSRPLIAAARASPGEQYPSRRSARKKKWNSVFCERSDQESVVPSE